MFPFKKKKKNIILTIHGFGKKGHHEWDPFALFCKQKGYEIIQFDLYDIHDPDDADPALWIQRAELQLKDVLSKNDKVIIIGFSMGGVIASYLASIYPIQQLILIAPAFQYLDAYKIGQYSLSALKLWNPSKKRVPSAKQTKAFTQIVDLYKESVSHVECPSLILHGTNDEVIPIDSSRWAYERMHCPKRLLFIEGGHHRMLYDKEGLESTCFALIDDMIQNRFK